MKFFWRRVNRFFNKNIWQNYIFTLLLILFFTVILRPVAFDAVDICLNENMTEDQLILSYGLPFIVTKPPQNAKRRLTRSELRWIFLMEIRLDAIKKALRNEDERAHKAYSAMVRDFNVRGANYEYETHEYIAAKRDVDAYKAEIVKNALAEMAVCGF